MPDPYTQLLEWRRGESTTRGLGKLPPDFYVTTQRYLSEIRQTFESELRANPSSRKGELARQTYQRAYQLARDIVEARTRKILDLAFQASLGGARELPNSLAEDRGLFDRFVDALRSHRGGVAPYLEMLGPAPTDPVPSSPALPPAPSVAALPSPASAPEPPTGASATAYVRIIKDGRPIALGNETLEIRKEDVLSVAEETAKLLVNAGLAVRLKTGTPRASVT